MLSFCLLVYLFGCLQEFKPRLVPEARIDVLVEVTIISVRVEFGILEPRSRRA